MSLEGVDDVHGSDGLSLGVLGIGDGVSDDSLEEALQDVSGVLVDVEGDSLDTTSSGESSDGWLGDALEQWSVRLSGVSLGSDLSSALADSLSNSLSGLSDSSHLFICNSDQAFLNSRLEFNLAFDWLDLTA